MSDSEFTVEDIRLLAALEVAMDAGEQPWVRLGPHRIAISPEAQEHFSLKVGQTITDTIHLAILRFNIAQCEAEIALRDRAAS